MAGLCDSQCGGLDQLPLSGNTASHSSRTAGCVRLGRPASQYQMAVCIVSRVRS